MKFVRNNRLKFLTLFVLIFFIGSYSIAQNKNIFTKDSIEFDEIAANFNTTVNQNPAFADSLAQVYFAKAKKLNNDDYMGRGSALISTAGMVLGKMDEAEKWYNSAQNYFKKSENYLWKGYSNLNMGTVLNQKYDFEKGLPYLLKSVEDFEQAKDYNMLASAYCIISNSFHDFGNYEKGKQYANIALKILHENKDIRPTCFWHVYNVLAINYDDNKEYEKAIENHMKALPYSEKDKSVTYNNLGNTYRKIGNIDSASYYLNLSIGNQRKNSLHYNDNYSFATVFGNLSDIERARKRYTIASQYLDSALYYAEKSKSPEKLMDVYTFAYNLKNETGDYKPAVEYLAKYVSLKDSLLNADKAKIIYNYQEQYEAEKKEKIIQQQQFEITKRNYWLLSASIAFVLLSTVVFFIYRNYKHKQDKKFQTEIFRQQEIEAKALFEGEQNERIRIARDLHDGVGQMLSVVKMNLSLLDTQEPSVIKALDLVGKTIDEVRNVSHNLIPEELNFGIFPALENLMEKINPSGGTKMEIHIPQEVRELKFETQNALSIYRIVQEVVNNMIKHAGASLIDLSIEKISNNLKIVIKDNGHGMDVNAMNRSEGIGWKNVNARVNLLDGKIKVQSEKLSGTSIEITLPGNGA